MHTGDQVPKTVRGTTFSFRKRWAPIDWRSLACVDVDRIAHEMDVKTLQQNIMNVTFCNMLPEEFPDLDPNFMKLFRLAQLVIEYLLYTQQYLSEQASTGDERIKMTEKERDELKAQLEVKQQEIVAVKKENRKRRKIIEKYQQMLNAGATGLHPCPLCRREFISGEYLQGHIARRHPDHLASSRPPTMVLPRSADAAPPEATPMEPPRPVIDHEEIKSQIIEQLNQKLLQSEVKIKESLSAKEFKLIEKKLEELTAEKQQDQERSKMEFEDYCSSILNELHQQKKETERLQEALQNAQDELKKMKLSKRVSHLGHLEGAEEIDLTGKKAKEEVTEIRNLMQTQLDEMKGKLKKQKKTMKEKMDKLSKIHQTQLSEYAERMKALEEACQTSLASSGNDYRQNIESLQQKLREQELTLSGYGRDLSKLKTTSETPVEVPNARPNSSTYSQEQSSEEDEESVTEEDGDDVDFHQKDSSKMSFTPFKHRPYIVSNFKHDPAQLERIRQVMAGALEEGMKRRGIDQKSPGIDDGDFNEKYEALRQERETRVNTHYNFMEHKRKLEQEVEDIVGQNYKPPIVSTIKSATPQPVAYSLQQTTPKSQEDKRKEPASPSRKQTSSTTPSKKSEPVKQVSSSAKPPPATISSAPPPNSVISKKPPIAVKSPREKEQEDMDSLTELTDESDSLELTPVLPESSPKDGKKEPVTHVSFVKEITSSSKPAPLSSPVKSKAVVKPSPLKMKDDEEDDSPWDSEDSIEDLAAPKTGNVISSTPIKALSVHGLDPTKRPPGGVPVMIVNHPPPDDESDESDTFTLSDGPRPLPKQKEVSIHDIPTIGGSFGKISKNPSAGAVTTGSSRSALTTVSSTVNDDFDSDFSDLEVTNLT